MFYNTTNQKGTELKTSWKKTENQEDIILGFFQNNKGFYSPDEVQEELKMDNTPLTSIRRAITNLTMAGKLEKTNLKRIGIYGKKVYCWRLKQISKQATII